MAADLSKDLILKLSTTLCAIFMLSGCNMATVNNETDTNKSTLRIATFNVSMEALNYVDGNPQSAKVNGNELSNALNADHQQIKNIAEIIQRVNPDIILLNEFDRQSNDHKSLQTFLNNYLAVSQQGNDPVFYPYFYQGPVNTGVATTFDLNNDGNTGVLPSDGYGYGHFPGHFAMVLLSKYPIDEKSIRSFQLFKWQDMPNALAPMNPDTNKAWYSDEAWSNLRLSSKSHWDIPVTINGKTLHVLASHPTPPVFDGPENRNGKRNYDELRFWVDYLTPSAASYIYDDKKNYGGLPQDNAFVILGDLNASSVDGNAIKQGIKRLTSHPRVNDPLPQSEAGKLHTPDNKSAANHTAFWRMRADYVLPSTASLSVLDSGIFWPKTTEDTYRLIKDRAASSDHRLVWVDVEFTK